MSYISNVIIQCEKKAYELFKEAWVRADFKPNSIFRSFSDGVELYTIKWKDVKWYDCFHDVGAITSVMDKLNEEYNDKEGYAYKCIKIGEDNATDERENEAAECVLKDFYVIVSVNLPEKYDIIEE